MVLNTVCYITFWPVGTTAAPLHRAEGGNHSCQLSGKHRGGDGDGLLILSYM